MANGFHDDGFKIYPDSNLFQWIMLKNDSNNNSFLISKFNIFAGLLPDNASYLHQNAPLHKDGLDEALKRAESLPTSDQRFLGIFLCLPELRQP